MDKKFLAIAGVGVALGYLLFKKSEGGLIPVGALTGLITDENGDPIAGVSVTYSRDIPLGGGSWGNRTVLSNASGIYTFAGLPLGGCSLFFEKTGYALVTKTLTIVEGANTMDAAMASGTGITLTISAMDNVTYARIFNATVTLNGETKVMNIDGFAVFNLINPAGGDPLNITIVAAGYVSRTFTDVYSFQEGMVIEMAHTA